MSQWSRHRRFSISALSIGWIAGLCLGLTANAQSPAEAGSPDMSPESPAQAVNVNRAPADSSSIAAAQVGRQPSLPNSASGANYTSTAPASPAASAAVSSNLPNAPIPAASISMKFIEPGQQAPVLNPGDKFLLGVRSTFSPFAISGWFAAAGFAQLKNGTPNFGSDRGAFGRRLEDSAIRAASEDLFSDSIMATILREDPRYYRLGPTHSFPHRFFYAATRPLVTRTDSGGTSANYALLTGNLAGAVLTNAYYPQANRTASQTVETFAASIGGSAFGDIVDEFFGQFLHRTHPLQH